MTTPEKNANGGGPRKVRPTLERTGPNRLIINAFYQSGGGQSARVDSPTHRMNGAQRQFEDDGVWGVASGPGTGGVDPAGPDAASQEPPIDNGNPDSAETNPDGRLWEDPFAAVRAAYGVVNDHIQSGYREAERLSQSSGPIEGKKLTRILNRLVQTYSDLGAQWVDLFMATAESRGDGVGTATAGAASHAGAPSIAVEVSTVRPVTARALLYRPAGGELSVWPLRRDGGGSEITDIAIAPGPVVTMTLGQGIAAGLYRGIIVEEGVEEPAGSVIVTVEEIGAGPDE